MLTLNSNSLAVVRLQMQLRQLDFYAGLIDGFYDETMRNAVIEFQKKYQLVPDGIAGPKTLTVANTVCADGFHTLFLHCSAGPEFRDAKAEQIIAMYLIRPMFVPIRLLDYLHCTSKCLQVCRLFQLHRHNQA